VLLAHLGVGNWEEVAMKPRRLYFGVVAALLLLFPAPAKAGLVYTISFDSMGSIPADSFSIFVPSVITSAQSISMPAGTELNGFYFSSLEIWLLTPTGISFGVTTRSFDWGDSDLAGFSFEPDAFPTTVGTYRSTNAAVRVYMETWVGFGRNAVSYPGSGTLTIADADASPVPDLGSTLLLFGMSVTGLVASNRRWRQRP
jgi:hypothetical protein